jgi:WD40-like Beta Propeller Repeat
MRTASLPLLLALVLSACSGESEAPGTADAAPDAPPGTDIHLFRLAGGTAEPEARITDLAGYDNQPYFTADGAQVLFTSDRTGNMDTFSYSLSDGTVTQVTHTAEGEYSPTTVPALPGWFSAIRMDMDGVQELWRYPLASEETPVPVAAINRVGYHTWVGNDKILFFRLGRPSTLQIVIEGTADTTVVAERVGRSLHKIPGERASSYLVTVSDDHREIRRYDWDSGESSAIAVPLEGGQDYAWTAGGALVMAIEGILYSYTPGADVDWLEIADLGLDETSRLAVSPDGTLLAVVAGRPE